MRKPALASLFAAAATAFACGAFDEEPTSSEPPAPDAAPTDDAAAQPDAAPGACGDTASDPKNCGRCGHDCLGGGCSGGQCLAAVVGTSSDAPVVQVAADAEHVYWLTASVAPSSGAQGFLYACPKTGCAPLAATPIVSGRQPGGLAADDAGAYASFVFGNGQIDRIEGNTTTRIAELDDLKTVLRLAKRGPSLFIDAYYMDPDAGEQSRTVVRWDGPGTRKTVGTFATPANAAVNTEHWHVTDQYVYLAAINVDDIVVCALPSCGSTWSTYLAGSDAHVVSLTGDESRLYWVGDDRVVSCATGPTCPGAREELTSQRLGSAKPSSVLLAGGRLTIATSPSGIYECDPADCAGTLRLVSEDTVDLAYTLNGHNLAFDGRALYYAAVRPGNERRIMKLAR